MEKWIRFKIIVLCVAVPAVAGMEPAAAQSTRSHLHSTFWAARGEATGVGAAPKVDPAVSCYASLSVTEGARGVRYWTGKC